MISRRFFLGGALAVAGAVAVAPALLASANLRIVGDGVHDDTAGLQALLDGKPADILTETVTLSDGTVRLYGGNFLIASTLHLNRNPAVRLDARYCSIKSTPDFRGDCMLWVHEWDPEILRKTKALRLG